jgi:hypothetical protein
VLCARIVHTLLRLFAADWLVCVFVRSFVGRRVTECVWRATVWFAVGTRAAGSIVLFKMGGRVRSYSLSSPLSFIVGGVFEHLLPFLLFWSMSYALIYIY